MELNYCLSTRELKPLTERSKCNQTQLNQTISLQALSNLKTLLKSRMNIMNKVRYLKLKNQHTINTLHVTDLREKLQSSLKKINNKHLPNSSTPFPSALQLRKSNSQWSIPTQLSLEIGSLFKVNYRNVRDFAKLHGSMSKLREIVKDQEVYSQKKELELQTKRSNMEDSVQNLQMTYNHNENHISALDQYIIFLKSTFIKERQILEQYDNQKNELKIDIRTVIPKIEKLKSIRELLLSYRNFCICVQEHTLSLPLEFIHQPFQSFQQRINKKKHTVIFNQRSNRKVVINRKKSKDYSQKTGDKQAYDIIINKNAIELYLNPRIPIFSSAEAFLQKLSYYDNENLKLAFEYNNSVTELEKYKKELASLEQEHKSLKEHNHLMKKKLRKRLVDLKQNNNLLQLTESHLRKALESKRNKRDIDRYMNQNRSVMQKANLPLFRYYNYCHELSFNKDFAYVFFYIGRLMSELYKEKPSLLKEYLDAQFKEEKFKEILIHLTEPDIYNQNVLRDDAIYCFRILESLINNVIITHRKFKGSNIIKDKLGMIEDQRKNQRTLLNSKENRFLQEKKRKKSVKEIWQKSNKILYRSHSGLFFNFKNKDFQNREVIQTSSSGKYANVLFDISEQSILQQS